MVISETELYKPLINGGKRTKHSVQQKLYIMWGTAGNPTAVLRSWQRQFVFDDWRKKENMNKRIGFVRN